MSSPFDSPTAPEEAEAASVLTHPGPPDRGRRAAGPPPVARTLLRAMRPKQWTKNVLVAAAPGGAGVLLEPAVLPVVGMAFVSFCLVASATYLINDVGDAEEDRRHPVKRQRPVAAGELPVRTALLAAVALLVVGLALALAVRPAFLAIVAGYLVMTVAYTVWLKHVAVFDIAVVASGFIVRAIAGGLAVDVPISRWFIIVTSFGSLFVVAGKRYSEHVTMGAERKAVRATLTAYSSAYLRYVYTMASGVTLLAYCLWAFEQSRATAATPWFELSIVPFAMAILRYALLLDEGAGGAPEEIVLSDRPLQFLGLCWLAIYVVGVSVAH